VSLPRDEYFLLRLLDTPAKSALAEQQKQITALTSQMQQVGEQLQRARPDRNWSLTITKVVEAISDRCTVIDRA
jgi:hypothetical protein